MTKLNVLPPSIGKLRCLKRLYLDHNGLKTLPFSISHCKYLAYLSLTFNKFSFFPGMLLTLTCLTDLRRQSNPTQPSLSLLAAARSSNYIRQVKCSPSKSDVKSTSEVPSLREMVMHTAVLSNIGQPYWKDESIPCMIVHQLDSAQNDYLICDNCHCAVRKGNCEGKMQVVSSVLFSNRKYILKCNFVIKTLGPNCILQDRALLHKIRKLGCEIAAIIVILYH